MPDSPSSPFESPQPGNAALPSSVAPADSLPSLDSRKTKLHSFVEWIALWLVAVAAAAISGGFLVDRFGSPFRIPAEMTAGFGAEVSAEQSARLSAVVRTINSKNLLVTFALAGAVIGLVFGLTAGLALRSWSGAMRGVLGGAALGCLFGLGGGWVAGFVSGRLQTLAAAEEDHKIIFALPRGMGRLRASAWLKRCLSLASGRPKDGEGAALPALWQAGLINGYAVYVPLVAFLAPSVDTTLLIPEGLIGKFYWVTFPAALTGLSLARALWERTTQPARS